MDRNISLINAWLKENHLLKSSRALEAEFGKITDTAGGTSLQQIFQFYDAMSGVMATMNPSAPQNNNITKKKIEKLEITDDEKDSKKTKTKDNKNKENLKTDKNIKKVPVPKLPKKIKVPLVPVGEWVCKEMERRLGEIFDETQHLFNMTDMSHITKVIQDTNIEIPGETLPIPNLDTIQEIDSGSDDSEATKTKKTIVKLSNGLVFSSPYVSNVSTSTVTKKEEDKE